jgi:hypothetical protein
MATIDQLQENTKGYGRLTQSLRRSKARMRQGIPQNKLQFIICLSTSRHQLSSLAHLLLMVLLLDFGAMVDVSQPTCTLSFVVLR